MIKFNWEKIKQICNYTPVNIIQYFCFKEKIWLPNWLPEDYKHKIYETAKYQDYPPGDNFILNIKPVLLNQKGYFIDDLYNYINLASARNYFDYKVRGIITLPTIIAKANRVDLNNPLLKVIGNEIHFKYETETNREVKNGH